jgi:hypothetical protein
MAQRTGMMITRRFRRVQRFAHVRAAWRTPGEGILVVDHEFEGGPLDGRRMTGLASRDDLHVVRCAGARRPRLVARAEPAERIGIYRFVRAYDCGRTVERVHAYRWHPSPPLDQTTASLATTTRRPPDA